MTKSWKIMTYDELLDEKYRLEKLLKERHDSFTQKQNRKLLNKINNEIYRYRVNIQRQ